MSKANASLEAMLTQTSSGTKKGDDLDSKVSLLEKKGVTNPFDKYEFMKRSSTKVYPVAEIIKTEKGKKGLEDMHKK